MQAATALGVTSSAPFAFYPGEAEVFRPRPREGSAEWAARHMIILAGRYRGQRWQPDVLPYARGIMAAWDAPWVRKIFFIAPSRSGKTTVAYSCLFAAMDKRPAPAGIGMPDQDAVERKFETAIIPHIQASPRLRKKLAAGRYALQKTEVRWQDGSTVYGMWAGSESRMSSVPMEYLLIDEEDAYADRIAVGTMEERCGDYPHTHKIFRFSKVRGAESDDADKGEGTIWRDMHRQAQVIHHYEAVCPACSDRQRMEFERIRVPEGERDPGRIYGERLAWYECRSCSYRWTDHIRDRALALGGWAPDRQVDRPAVVGFRLRSWELPLVSLSKVMADWFAAQGDPRKMQLWDNAHASKPYKHVTIEASEERIAALINDEREQLTAPAWTVALTLSADMQKDYFRYSVMAHGLDPDRECIIDYGSAPDFESLRKLVFESTYRLEGTDLDLAIWRAALDTGGSRHGEDESRTMQAYEWLLDLPQGPLFATKGMSRKTPGQYVKWSIRQELPNGRKLKSGLRLYLIDTDAFKSLWFHRLEQSVRAVNGELRDGERFDNLLEFHAETGPDYLREVTAERLIQGKNGKQEWKRFRANHWLDCAVGHLAMVHFQWAPSLRAVAAHLLAERNPVKAKVERKKESINPYTNGVNVFGGVR